MSDIGNGFLVSDGIHPNDIGYQRMADRWYQAIKKIPGGWLKAPIGPDPHPFVADNAPGHLGCLAGRDLTALEARATKTGHHCLGLPIWTSLGRISHGVSYGKTLPLATGTSRLANTYPWAGRNQWSSSLSPKMDE